LAVSWRGSRHAGYEGFELFNAPVIDRHPRVIGTLRARPVDGSERRTLQTASGPSLSTRASS
jgi:hypothetical protein